MNAVVTFLIVALWSGFGFAAYAAVMGSKPRPRSEALGWSLVLGLGCLGYVLFLASVLGQRPNRLLVLGTPVLLTLLIGGFCAWRRRCPRFPGATKLFPSASRVWPALGIAVLVTVEAVAVIAVAVRMDFWDAFSIWGFKAKELAIAPLAGNPFFADPTLAYTHLSYPVGVPLQYAAVYSVLGGTDEFAAKLLCIFQYTAYAALVYAVAAVHFDRLRSMLLTLAAVCLPLPMLVAAKGYGDFPLTIGCLAMLYGLSLLVHTVPAAILLLSLHWAAPDAAAEASTA